MIARASELFLPTLREPPADAESASHRLLVRGGFIRQVGAGLWTFLPLGVREFIMKGSYSCDRDEAGLDESFERHRVAYERIFERCGLDVYYVEAESGIMGGKESMGFLAPTGSGENELMRCENGDYFADIEAARGVPRAPAFPEALNAPHEIETPGVATIDALAEFLGVDPAATSKAMPVVTGDRVVLALVRGDDRLSEEKLTTVFQASFRPATEDEIREAFGAR